MKAVTGSAGASFQQGNPALAVKCSNHKEYSVQILQHRLLPHLPVLPSHSLGRVPGGLFGAGLSNPHCKSLLAQDP